jgi:hypothetical protein
MSYKNYYAAKTEQGHKKGRSPWEIKGRRKEGKFYSRKFRRIFSGAIIKKDLMEYYTAPPRADRPGMTMKGLKDADILEGV